MNIGDRVGAFQSYNSQEVRVFGFGVYAGEQPHELFGLNPRIDLDCGEQIWGCMCWWDSEQRIKEIIALSKNIIYLDVKEEIEKNKRDIEEFKNRYNKYK